MANTRNISVKFYICLKQRKGAVISLFSIQYIVSGKCECLCYYYRYLVLYVLLIIGGIEQNPGPGKKGDKNRRAHQSRSTCCIPSLCRKSYDVNNSYLSASVDEENSELSQILLNINTHINTNMSYVQKNLNGLKTKVDDVSCACVELRIENEKLRKENKELLRKIAVFEARLDILEAITTTDELNLPKSEKLSIKTDVDELGYPKLRKDKKKTSRKSNKNIPGHVEGKTCNDITQKGAVLDTEGKIDDLTERKETSPVSAKARRYRFIMDQKTKKKNNHSTNEKLKNRKHSKQREIKTLPELADRATGEEVNADQSKADLIKVNVETPERSNASLHKLVPFTKYDMPEFDESDKIPTSQNALYEEKAESISNLEDKKAAQVDTSVAKEVTPYSKPFKNKTKKISLEENKCKSTGKHCTTERGAYVSSLIDEFGGQDKEKTELVYTPEAQTQSEDKMYRSSSLVAKRACKHHKTAERAYSTPVYDTHDSNNKDCFINSNNKKEEGFSNTLPAAFSKQVSIP